MAHKKGQGSTRNGRDSKPKFRGVKKFDGQLVPAGTILVRQVGNKFYAGDNVAISFWQFFVVVVKIRKPDIFFLQFHSLRCDSRSFEFVKYFKA